MSDDPNISLIPVQGTYTIHRLKAEQEIPVIGEGFFSVTVTDEEVSVVCLEDIEIDSEQSSPSWKCIKVAGPLELNLVGVLHDLTKPLKEAGISVFAISTYDTDYLLVPERSYNETIQALSDQYVLFIE
ncbi:ACT domain-containing protein [Bacteroidota bacterium]